MKAVAKKLRTRWQKFSRVTQIVILSLIALTIAVRASLPHVVKRYVNHQLSKIQDYQGSVHDIDIHLWRGAYTIRDIRIIKTSGKVPVPFFSTPALDLSLQWKELFHGSVVGEVTVEKAQLNFVAGPTKEESQTGAHKGWDKILESLFPFRLNKFELSDGDLRFRDFSKKPNVDIFVHHLFATATNLSNTRQVAQTLPAGLHAYGITIGDGRFDVHLQINPMAPQPTFKLDAAITNMNLVALNDFLRAYGRFDVERGIFSVYTEVAAADGRYEGYIKPLFENLDVFDWQKERGKNILEKFWEAIVAGVAQILKNHPKDRLATKIPISGNFEKTDVDIWATIGGILKNAFVRALLPKFDRDVSVQNVEKKDQKPEKPSRTPHLTNPKKGELPPKQEREPHSTGPPLPAAAN